MSPTDGIFIWCNKRKQRLSVSVCLFRKCKSLREKDGNFLCNFKSAEEKRIRKGGKNK